MPKRSTKSGNGSNGRDGSERPDLSHDFLVVGLGASAGGIEALSVFFANVPADSGAAYVVILHLSPDHESRLAHVLQQVTGIPVEQVTQRTTIRPNHVYVVPPDRSLAMRDGHIMVNPLHSVEERRAPVDIFFRTLAESHGPNAVGVILSGTGANGSMGLKRIKEFGGATFAQNPRESQFNEMPRNAIATELVDAILPVADIPGKILAYRDSRALVSIADEPQDRSDGQQTALRDIFTQIRVRTGHDFSNYKRPTILRRIERRISVKSLPDIQSYAAYVRENPDEAQHLLKDLLISVTNFFRDKNAFEALEKEIVPRILDGSEPKRPVRIWVAGCATGEEAYSLAMIFAERTMGDIGAPAVQIFATDIDQQAIAIAREGLYTLNDAADVSPERLRRFFNKEGENYRVRREIREMVLFAQHNILKDPPFSHLDLVTCRNLMIYFNQTAQERALETIHFALDPGGYVFIGSSESVEGSGDLFAAVDKENHIYQSRQATNRPLPVPESVPVYRTSVIPSADSGRRPAKRDLERTSFNELHLRLLEEFAPPSIVVDPDYEIVHLSESAGKYLQVIGGEPTNNLLRLVRPEIRLELRSVLFQAVQQKTNVEAHGLEVRFGDHVERINLLVRPVLSETDTARGYILVAFEPSTDGAEAATQHVEYAPPEPVAQQLEEELVRSRSQLQSALEQAEVQSEELRASNEELQAMNEELRSSAEELETSKEELQSINEELTTVNQELKVKIEELSHTNNNFQNLLNSIDIGVIFLDRSLRVNLFSPSARRIFNLIQNDVGRPLSDITSRITYDDLAADAEKVITSLQTVEREVRSIDERDFLMRIFPYRTAEDHINGVVVMFVDITERKRAEQAVSDSERRLQRMVNVPLVGVLTFDHDGRVLHANDAFLAMVGYGRSEFDDQSFTWRDFTPSEYVEDSEQILEQVITTGRGGPYEREYFRKDGSRAWLMFVGADLGDGTVIEYAIDIGDRKRAEEAVSRSEARLAEDLAGMRRLYDLHAKLAVETDLHQAMREIAAAAAEFTHTDRGCVQLVSDDREHLEMFAWHGYDDDSLFINHFHCEGSKAARDMARRHKARFVTEDIENSPAFAGTRDREVALAEDIRAAQSTPLVNRDGELIGMLSTQFRQLHRPTDDEYRLIDLLAWTAADFIERHRVESALRATEERMRRLMESFTDVALFTTDTANVVTTWNPGAQKIFGFTAEEMIGKRSADIIFTPEDRASGEAEKERETARREGRAPDERWHLRKDGTRFFASGVMVPLTDGEELVGYGKVARDLTERKQFEEQLKRAHDELEVRVADRTSELDKSNRNLRQEMTDRKRAEEERVELLRKIVTTQEDERRRIARDLHDQMGQRLTALRLKIASLKEQCGGDERLCSQIEALQELGARIDSEVSFLAWELRPTVLDDLGLVTAVENFVREWSEHFGIKAEFHETGLKRKRFTSEIETNLYRITQEALNNVYKHAHATAVNVLLELRRKEVVLIVEDNGFGFDVEQQRLDRRHGSAMGLLGMHERAAIVGGTVEIESGADKGTTVFARIPAVFAKDEKEKPE